MEEQKRPLLVPHRTISKRFRRLFHQKYAWWKLLLDPLYDAVAETIIARAQPVLDLGCGIGLLAFYLRECKFMLPVRGLDFDSEKIRAANFVAQSYIPVPVFFQSDLQGDWPEHKGTVTLLDVLQYLPESARDHLLHKAAACVAPGGALIIRSGIADGSRRHGITKLIDYLGLRLLWMKSGPASYPTQSWLEEILTPCGLSLDSSRPLTGALPLNNHLFVFTRL